MANWTIRSKTEKTSLASTDGVPMQEAGGTTKWFSLSSLATFLGIPTLQGYFNNGSANRSRSVTMYDDIQAGGDIYSWAQDLSSDYYLATAICRQGATYSPNASISGFSDARVWKMGDANFIYMFAQSLSTKSTAFVLKRGGTWDTTWTQLTNADGNPVVPVVATTASAANAYIAGSGNTILQSTSSAKYKTDIRDLEDTSTLDALRPVLYKSNPETVPGDDPTLDHYGFIAEEIAKVDTKLVEYKEDESGEKTPNGVQYDRVVVLLVKRIQELEARLAKAGI